MIDVLFHQFTSMVLIFFNSRKITAIPDKQDIPAKTKALLSLPNVFIMILHNNEDKRIADKMVAGTDFFIKPMPTEMMDIAAAVMGKIPASLITLAKMAKVNSSLTIGKNRSVILNMTKMDK